MSAAGRTVEQLIALRVGIRVSIQIAPIAEEHIDSFRSVLDLVARERRYLAMVEAPSPDEVRQFVRQNIAAGWPDFVAIEDGAGQALADFAGQCHRVVGWCDIVPDGREGFRHGGRLGLGVHPDYRRRGVGSQLLEAALRKADEIGLERVELEVFATNTTAVQLYERYGFVQEGLRRRVRKIDGQYDDNVLMCRMLSKS
jgi:ribosomal protein S18 acetylase RimI-like enzyme